MKNCYYTLLLFPFLLFSCKDKEVQCVVKKYNPPVNIAFKGFTAAQLDTIVYDRYSVGSGFQTPVKTVVSVNTDIIMFHDTAFVSGVKLPFAQLDANTEYTITIGATGNRYHIADIQYDNDTMYAYSAVRDCGIGTILHPPYSVSVDGQPTSTTYIAGGSSWIILSK